MRSHGEADGTEHMADELTSGGRPRFPALELREALVIVWAVLIAELASVQLRPTLEAALRGASGAVGKDEWRLLYTGAWRAFDFLLAAAILRFGYHRRLTAAGLHARRPLLSLTWTANLGAALGVLFVLILWAYGKYTGRNLLHELEPLATTGAGPAPRTLILLLVTGAVAPFVEEFVFRGILHQGLRNVLAPAPAVVAGSALFALAHVLVGIPYPVFQFLGGLVTATAFERTRSLLAPVLLHCAGNVFFWALAQWAP